MQDAAATTLPGGVIALGDIVGADTIAKQYIAPLARWTVNKRLEGAAGLPPMKRQANYLRHFQVIKLAKQF